MDIGVKRQLRKAIEEAVSTKPEEALPSPENPSPQQTSPHLAAIKKIVRYHEEAAAVAVDCLLGHLKARHSQERLGALLVSDCLFRRSSAFRLRFSREMDDVLSLTTGVKGDQPLPPPQSYARRLKAVSIPVFEAWSKGFGDKIRSVTLAYNYLEARLGLSAEPVDREAQETERLMQEERTRLRLQRIEQALKEIAEYELEIRTNVESMERLLGLITGFHNEVDCQDTADSAGPGSSQASSSQKHNPSTDQDIFSEAFQDGEDDNQERMEDVVRDLGLGAAGYSLDIEISEQVEVDHKDHAPLLEGLGDGLKLIRNKHAPLVEQWSMISEHNENTERDAPKAEKRLQNKVQGCLKLIQDVLEKCDRAGLDAERKQSCTPSFHLHSCTLSLAPSPHQYQISLDAGDALAGLSAMHEVEAGLDSSSECELEDVPLYEDEQQEESHREISSQQAAGQSSSSIDDAEGSQAGAGGLFGQGSVGQEDDFRYSRTGRKLKASEARSKNQADKVQSGKKKKGRKRMTKKSRLAPLAGSLFKRLVDKSRRLKEEKAHQSGGLMLQTNSLSSMAHRRSRNHAFGISNKALRD